MNESTAIHDDDRPLHTGNSIVFIRESLPAGLTVDLFLRALLPEGAPEPLVREIRPLPGRRYIARLHVRPEELNRPVLDLLNEGTDRAVLVSAERRLFPEPPKEAARVESPGAALTWGLEKIGITGHPGEPTGCGAVVAVLDTGIDATHRDFLGRVRPRDILSVIDLSAHDVHGHGTHCAGIVAGPANPTGGVPRYAVAPDARLLAINIYESGTASSFDWALVAGLWWAAVKKAHVASLSLGRALTDMCQKHDPLLEAYIEFLLDWTGLVVVAATGDANNRHLGRFRPIHHPANSPPVVSVAAVDPTPSVANFSCGRICGQVGPFVAAPGVAILSAVPVGSGPLHKCFNGTSQAAPHVAGIAALWVEKGVRGRPLIAKLTSNVVAAGHSDDVGAGLVQIP